MNKDKKLRLISNKDDFQPSQIFASMGLNELLAALELILEIEELNKKDETFFKSEKTFYLH